MIWWQSVYGDCTWEDPSSRFWSFALRLMLPSPLLLQPFSIRCYFSFSISGAFPPRRHCISYGGFYSSYILVYGSKAIWCTFWLLMNGNQPTSFSKRERERERERERGVPFVTQWCYTCLGDPGVHYSRLDGSSDIGSWTRVPFALDCGYGLDRDWWFGDRESIWRLQLGGLVFSVPKLCLWLMLPLPLVL